MTNTNKQQIICTTTHDAPVACIAANGDLLSLNTRRKDICYLYLRSDSIVIEEAREHIFNLQCELMKAKEELERLRYTVNYFQ